MPRKLRVMGLDQNHIFLDKLHLAEMFTTIYLLLEVIGVVRGFLYQT